MGIYASKPAFISFVVSSIALSALATPSPTLHGESNLIFPRAIDSVLVADSVVPGVANIAENNVPRPDA